MRIRWNAPSRRPTAVLPAALAVTLLPLAGSVSAQDWRPQPGDRSIEFALPEGGGVGFGLWSQRTATRALGLRFSLGGTLTTTEADGDPLALDRTHTTASVGFGPALKWYRQDVGPVTPFLYGSLMADVAYAHDRYAEPGEPDQSTDSWVTGGSARIGIGVDWFPLDRVSIGGYTGGALLYRYQRSDTPAGVATRHDAGIATFTSGLSLHIYF